MVQGSSPGRFTSIWIGWLPSELTEEVLLTTCSKVAPVASVKIARDFITRQPLGHGYVNFKPSEIDAGAAAVAQLNLTSLYSFRAWGEVKSAQLLRDIDRRPVYGFVLYADPASADKAIHNANGKLMLGSKLYVGPHIRRQRIGIDSTGRRTGPTGPPLPRSLSSRPSSPLAHGAVVRTNTLESNDGWQIPAWRSPKPEPAPASSTAHATHGRNATQAGISGQGPPGASTLSDHWEAAPFASAQSYNHGGLQYPAHPTLHYTTQPTECLPPWVPSTYESGHTYSTPWGPGSFTGDHAAAGMSMGWYINIGQSLDRPWWVFVGNELPCVSYTGSFTPPPPPPQPASYYNRSPRLGSCRDYSRQGPAHHREWPSWNARW
ncbi:hypothetical protein WJX73_010655 [Symbiochloris irregularis]|uniref:RRM domain-containing protein n=1 Tax=Symbiochloris irregularis TaxID=706552 RepID=A0AAW1NT17_9CHLO